jgi:hypothetical protein
VLRFGDNRLEPVFEFPPVLGTGKHCAEIQGNHLLFLECFRDIPGDNPLGKTVYLGQVADIESGEGPSEISREQQIERAMRRDGLSRDEVLTRLDRQMPLEEKRKFADFVIDTSGEKEMTIEQVRQLYGRLVALLP